MSSESGIARHYAQGTLLSTIEAGLKAAGLSPKTVTAEDLAAVDEFHIGGRPATLTLLDQLHLERSQQVLDIGCGLGGPARVAARRYGCAVTGLDLTSEFIAAAAHLSQWVGLGGQVDFHCGSALAMPFKAGQFDAAYMLHVGMNIADKAALFAEVARVLKPGKVFGLYDVMRLAEGEIAYPVPWARQPDISFLATPETYRQTLEAAGFSVEAEHDRRDFAIDFFKQMQARMAGASGPPPLGLHLVMGSDAPLKIRNTAASIERGLVAPREMIARLLT